MFTLSAKLSRGGDMKSAALIVCGLLLVFTASSAVLAQGTFGMPFPGPGQAPGNLMMPGSPGGPGPAPGAPGCGWPIPVPQGCQPKQSDPLSFVAYGGYLYHPDGLTYTRDHSTATGLPGLRIKLPTQGAWFGAAAKLKLSDNAGFAASGGVLIPTWQTGEASEEGAIGTLTRYGINAEQEWWYLDGMGSYTIAGCSYSGLQAVAGFRWDHLNSTQHLNWADVATGGAIVSGTGTNNLKINGYLPYFGIQSVYRSCTDSVNVRVIGFPYIPGELKFQHSFVETEGGVTTAGGGAFANPQVDIQSGYFVELFADAGRKVVSDLWLGAFARWQYLTGKTAASSFDLSTPNGVVSFSETINFYTRAWVLGGLVGVDFNLF
jgi:hypothetical protein